MAYSGSDGFRYFRSLSGQGEMPAPIRFLIEDSTTLRIGDMARVMTDGWLVPAGVGNPVLGVVVGLVDNDGINVLGFSYTGQTGHTDASANQGDDTVTTASDNTTRARAVFAEVVIDAAGDILWLNDASGSLAATNLMQLFDVDAADSRTVDQSSASDTNGQLQLVVLDPEATGGKTADVSKGAFRIAEGQIAVGVDQGNAIVAA